MDKFIKDQKIGRRACAYGSRRSVFSSTDGFPVFMVLSRVGATVGLLIFN
jgi:hypothetical protein